MSTKLNRYSNQTYAEAGTRFGKSLAPESYYEVRYEDLIFHPKSVTRQIFDFLEGFKSTEVDSFFESLSQAKTQLVGKGRNKTTADDLAVARRESGELFKLLGYEIP